MRAEGMPLQCLVCGHANSDDARFCSNCGTALERRCQVCSTPYAPDDRFCSQCGASLLDTPSAEAPGEDLARWVPEELLRKIRAARSGHTMRGERRTVTMLFADIQGSTAAAERLDPEEWADIVNGAFGRLIAPVYRYEGTLARLQGDAILAFFGAPIAHEDDPVRAVRAGLDIIAELESHAADVGQRLGVPLAVRVGINTGLVVVGEVGSDLRVEYTALGDAINVAARMEQTAQPGTVQVTQETVDLLGGLFATDLIGPVEVKGKQEPVLAHRVLAFRPGQVGDRQVAPLVGREQEQTRLGDLLDGLATGVGGIVTLVGEAGMGKSRLVAALRELADGRGTVAETWDQEADVAWLSCRARSYERDVPHAMVVELLGSWGLGATDEEAIQRASGRLDLADVDVPTYLADLVRAPLSAEGADLVGNLPPVILNRRTTDAVVDYLGAEAARRPLVVVLDDLHWADANSLAIAERLMEVAATRPLLLVLVTRPMRDEPSWRLVELAAREHPHRHLAIDLQALPIDVTSDLLARLLGDLTVDEDVRAQVLDRSNGNPLFIEELVRSLRDGRHGGQGADAAARVEVPTTLTSLLTARLDALDEVARHVAQVASVIGREFDAETVTLLLEPGEDLLGPIDELLRRGILEEHRRHPVVTYAFRHPLIRETAYGTVLLKTRRILHRRVAQHLEAQADRMPQEVARHYVEAGDPAAAFPHLVESGRRAVRSLALGDAIQAFSLALDTMPEEADPELVLQAHDGLGEAYGLVPDLPQSLAAYQSLLDYGRSSDRPAIQVAALNRLGFAAASIGGDYEAAVDYLGQARAVAEDVGDDLGLAEYHMTMCFVASQMGDIDNAIGHDNETVRIGQASGHRDLHLKGLMRKLANLGAVMRWQEADEIYDEALELATGLGNEEFQSLLQVERGGRGAMRDADLSGAIELLQHHLPVLDRWSSMYGVSFHLMLAEYALLAGDVELALAEYATSDRLARERGQLFATAAALSGRARTLATCGLADELPGLRADAIALVQEVTGEFYSTTVWADVATSHLYEGDLDAAREVFTRALGATAVTQHLERPRVWFGLARVALAEGDLATAHGHLDGARRHVAVNGLRLYEAELLLLDGILAMLQRRDDDARSLLAGAETAAAESGRRPVRVEALRHLAALRRRQGDATEATTLSERADELDRQLAGAIVDAGLREAYAARTQAPSLAIPDLGT